jgi:predicted nucleic acid-binding protein
MSANLFVDTNVLVYSRDSSEPDKQRRAHLWVRELWRTGRGRLSLQVLQEYYVTVTSKLSPGLDATTARREVLAFSAWRPVAADVTLMESAWSLQDRFSLSWWDALIVAAAKRSGSRFLLTEDLRHEQTFDRLRVVNPFHCEPGDILSDP